jgi:hypothetical protein
VTQADAIVVLGGGLQTRPFAAAKLHHQGKSISSIASSIETSPLAQRAKSKAHSGWSVSLQAVLGASRLMPLRFRKSNRRWTQMDTDFQEITPIGVLPRQPGREIRANPLLSAFIRVHLRLKFHF